MNFLKKVKNAINPNVQHVKIKRLDGSAVMPSYAHDGDIGMDLTAISVEYDEVNDLYLYHTGISIETKKNLGTFLFVRSSNRKTDSYLANHVAVIDSYLYRGELIICYKNRDSLRLMARDAQIEEFFKQIRNGESIEYAANKAVEVFKDFMEDKEKIMSLAPYKVGDRIAQMVFVNHKTIELTEVVELSQTVRGENGFGSTGN